MKLIEREVPFPPSCFVDCVADPFARIAGSRSQTEKKEVPHQFGDTMAESNQRASRSRYSSPFAIPPNAGANSSKPDAAERPKTFMDRW